MLIGIAWFVLAFAAGLLAERRHRSGLGWFFIAVLLSPLLAFVLLLVMAPGEDKDAATCPACAETVKAEAIVCKHCGAALPGLPDVPEAAAVDDQAPPAPVRAWERPAVIGSLALIVLMAGVFVVRELRAPKALPAEAAAVDPAADREEACRQARFLVGEHLKAHDGTLAYSGPPCEGLTLEAKFGGWEVTTTAWDGADTTRALGVVQARLQQPTPGSNLMLCRMTVDRKPVQTPDCG